MLSLPKIILTLVVVLGAIYGYRLFTRARAAVRDSRDKNQPPKPIDLVKCPVCEKYVEPSTGKCERADCPRG